MFLIGEKGSVEALHGTKSSSWPVVFEPRGQAISGSPCCVRLCFLCVLIYTYTYACIHIRIRMYIYIHTCMLPVSVYVTCIYVHNICIKESAVFGMTRTGFRP